MRIFSCPAFWPDARAQRICKSRGWGGLCTGRRSAIPLNSAGS
jgi:hypothetical protein